MLPRYQPFIGFSLETRRSSVIQSTNAAQLVSLSMLHILIPPPKSNVTDSRFSVRCR